MPKPKGPLTGRLKEIFKAIYTLSRPNNRKNKLVNVIGPDGIGKTRVLQEIAYGLNSRFFFQEGIFYFDLRGVNSIEKARNRVKELKIGGKFSVLLQHESQKCLLILDNVDSLIKNHTTNFDWWLLEMINKFNLKIIISSKKEYNCKADPKLTQERMLALSLG